MYTKLQDDNILCLAAKTSNPRPTILIFDSGVGGLSIYNEIRQKIPDLHYVYVFDNVAFPYGERDEGFIIERVVKIISAVQQCYPPTLAVIACNTASTISLSALRKKFHFMMVGVVPAIKPAALLTANGIIGLLATSSTVKSPYTRKLIDCFANKCKTVTLSSAKLVEIAEAKLHGEIVSLDELRHILSPWLCMSDPPDTVVLGCTHFPLLQEELLQVFQEGTRLVDSGAAIARRTAWLLEENEVSDTTKSLDVNIAFCVAVTKKTKQLFPILRRYDFEVLKKIPL